MKKDDIRKYIQQLISEGEEWKAIKMVVLGNGRIGKTTLLRAFDDILRPDQSTKVHYFFLLFFFEQSISF